MSQAEPLAPRYKRSRAELHPELVKPGVAGLGQRLAEIQAAGIALFPVVENEVPDVQRAGATELARGLDFVGLERCDSNKDLERGSCRIGRTIGTR